MHMLPVRSALRISLNRDPDSGQVLPTIGREFSSDAAGISWLGTIFFLVAGVFLIPFGRLADILGVRRLFSTGVGIYQFAAIISALLLLGASFIPSPIAMGMLVVGGLLLAGFVIYAGSFARFFLFSLSLQVARDLDPRSAGLVLVLNPVAMALLSPLAGRLADRGSVGPGASVGVALFATPVVKSVIGAVEREVYAVASSTVETMRLVGMTLSMACTTIAFTLSLAGRTIEGTGPVPLIGVIHGISLLYLALVIGALLLLRISIE